MKFPRIRQMMQAAGLSRMTVYRLESSSPASFQRADSSVKTPWPGWRRTPRRVSRNVVAAHVSRGCRRGRPHRNLPYVGQPDAMPSPAVGGPGTIQAQKDRLGRC
jgi:hypothetical protein